MKTTIKFLAALVGAGLLSGCATMTPEQRIRAHPQAFQGLSPAQQQAVSQGQVEVGFTKDMVRLALGEPDQVYTVTNQQGTADEWLYGTSSWDGAPVFYGRYYGGWPWYRGWYPYWGGYYDYWDYPDYANGVQTRVDFGADGKVTSITQRQTK